MSQQAFGFNVLVVDDDRDFASCVRDGLALDGCDVRIAHNETKRSPDLGVAGPHRVLQFGEAR